MDVLDIESPEITSASTLSDLLESMPDTRRRIVQAWLDGLTATKWQYDLVTKKKVVEPDHKQRCECASKLAAYLEGMPAQTTIVKIPKNTDEEKKMRSLREAAKFSPEMRASLREVLAELEAAPDQQRALPS